MTEQKPMLYQPINTIVRFNLRLGKSCSEYPTVQECDASKASFKFNGSAPLTTWLKKN